MISILVNKDAFEPRSEMIYNPQSEIAIMFELA